MAKPRSKSQARRDRRIISELYLKGLRQIDIVEEVGVSVATVSRDLKLLTRYWQVTSRANIDKAKAIELAKINELERTYWQAWKDSTGDKEIQTIENPALSIDGESVVSKGKETLRRWVEVGDPRFLQGVQACIDKRCKIRGVDAPQAVDIKASVTTENSDKLRSVIDKMSDDQRKVFFEMIEKSEE